MKLISVLIICSFFYLMTSCSTSYGVANRASHTRNLQKPSSKDSLNTAIYVGAQFYRNNGFESNFSEEASNFSEISIYRSHTHKNFKYSYGVFSYLGSYDVQAIEMYKGDKSLYGIGVIADANLVFPVGNFDINLLGVRLSALKEFGEFSEFREMISNQDAIEDLNTNNQVLFLGIVSGINTTFKEVNGGMELLFGRTFENGKSSQGSILLGTNFFVTYKRFTATIQLSNSFQMMNTYSFGLQYKII